MCSKSVPAPNRLQNLHGVEENSPLTSGQGLFPFGGDTGRRDVEKDGDLSTPRVEACETTSCHECPFAKAYEVSSLLKDSCR